MLQVPDNLVGTAFVPELLTDKTALPIPYLSLVRTVQRLNADMCKLRPLLPHIHSFKFIENSNFCLGV